jgi:hypothetical protein
MSYGYEPHGGIGTLLVVLGVLVLVIVKGCAT